MSASNEPFDVLRLALSRLFAADRRLRHRDQQRRDGSLTYAQVRSLVVLVQEGEVTAGRLAKAADLNPASVTAMIDQLERGGFVRRRPDTQDRRQSWISLTDEGRLRVEQKERLWRARMADLLADVTPAELAAAVKVMDLLGAMMEESAREAEQGPSPVPG